VELGIPTDGDPSDDYIITRTQYTLSYNHTLNATNWVSYNLNADWYGDVPRYSGNFIQDTDLPQGWFRAKHSDYTNSGYDRGHLVRSEERTKTEEDNRSTFILTNVLPQRPDMNQGVWLKFERWCETMCKDSLKELYIVTGGIFHEPHELVNDKIAVPDTCYKIVVVLARGQRLDDVNAAIRVVSVAIPNIQGVRNDEWTYYQTSVDRLEASTGYDFLPRVPVEVQEVIER
jgi:endonuclease G